MPKTFRPFKSLYKFEEEYPILKDEIPEALYGMEPYDIKTPYDRFLLPNKELRDASSLVEKDYIRIVPIDFDEIFDEVDPFDAFIKILTGLTGLPIKQILNKEDKVNGTHHEVQEINSLIQQYGNNAMAGYFPMHAFYESTKPSWGIYLFLDEIMARAKYLFKYHRNELSMEQHFTLYFFCIYRHELFHYQVEQFATKLEILNRKAYYKNYRQIIEPKVRHTEDWLEESLAEAAVLNSRLVTNRTKIKREQLVNVYSADANMKPAGYRDYDCYKYGGQDLAMKHFSSQIIEGRLHPKNKITDLISIKSVYHTDDKQVPGYLVFPSRVIEKFQ